MRQVVDDQPFQFLAPAGGVPHADIVSRPLRDDAPNELDPAQVAMRFKWWLMLGLLLGVGLGNLAFVKLGPEFNAVAQILVSRRAQVPLKDSIAQAWGERGEHIAIIKSPMIVGKAVETGKLAEMPSLQSSTDPVEDILDSLEVRRTAGQDQSFLNVLELKYRNRNRADARAVLNAIIVAYREYIAESQAEVTNELGGLVDKMNSDLSRQIAQKQQELLNFRNAAPLIWRTAPGDQVQPGDVTNVHQERVVEIERDRRANLLRRAEINGKLKALQNAVDQTRSHAELENLVRLLVTAQPNAGANGNGVAALGAPASPPPVDQADVQLLPLLLEEQTLLRDFAADHPDVINVRKKIARLKEFYAARGVVLPEVAGRKAADDKGDFVSLYRQFLEQQLQELDHKDAELAAIYDVETKNVKDLIKFMVQDQALREELDRLKDQFNALISKVSEVEMTRENNGYAMKLLSPVREEWSWKRYVKIVGPATLLIFGLFAGVIFFREWNDATVKSVNDGRRLMRGGAVLGSVPDSYRDSDDREQTDAAFSERSVRRNGE